MEPPQLVIFGAQPYPAPSFGTGSRARYWQLWPRHEAKHAQLPAVQTPFKLQCSSIEQAPFGRMGCHGDGLGGAGGAGGYAHRFSTGYGAALASMVCTETHQRLRLPLPEDTPLLIWLRSGGEIWPFKSQGNCEAGVNSKAAARRVFVAPALRELNLLVRARTAQPEFVQGRTALWHAVMWQRTITTAVAGRAEVASRSRQVTSRCCCTCMLQRHK